MKSEKLLEYINPKEDKKLVSVRLPFEVFTKVEGLTSEYNVSRDAMIVALLKIGLDNLE